MDGDRFGLGLPLRRKEDARFLIGKGAYLDDLHFPGVGHAVFVRSPHAHAGISGIDTSAARASPGVAAVFTAADVEADGLNPLPPTVEANVLTGERFHFTPLPLLARDEVRFVGQLVALVVAETKTAALDAAELVRVNDMRPAVMAAETAAANPDLLCMDWQVGDASDAFARAAHVVSLKLLNHRIVTNPMEPRGVVGVYDPEADQFTAYVSSQSLHGNRDAIARVLKVPPEKLRFIAPDVGGGFGAKNFPYPEQALIPWAAKRLGRPVKWIASRSEVFVSDHQARDHHADASLALDKDGHFLGLKVASISNIGAYMCGGAGALQTFQYPHLQGGIYNVPQVELHVRTVLTNATPIGVTRGPGFAEAINIIERLVDAAARQCGFDRASLRRRNMARTPMTNAMGYAVDSGDFPGTFDKAIAAADLPGFAARRRDSEAAGLRGLGFACHIKGTGGNPSENVDIRFDADGSVLLITGTQTIGQGHETTFPQIVAHCLGIPNDRVRLVYGDTGAIVAGGGHGSSRATYMGGTAIFRASQDIVAKGKPIAASILEAAEGDIDFSDGDFQVAGTDRRVSLLNVAAVARAANTPLDIYHFWTREHMTFPNGTHVVEVEVDPDTGRVALVRHTAVDDYGVIVNPLIASGQAHGAIAQGAGQALMEQAVFDAVTGQPATGSFMDYTLPRAADFPAFNLDFNNTICTTNPLGVKGCGEAAAVGVFPAINNAVADALGSDGIHNGPVTGERIWRELRAGR